MKRQINGLNAADRCATNQIPDGVFFVRVQRAQFRRQAQKKPYYTLSLAILEPSRFSGHVLSSRLYCSPKALWKLNWFLRDFGYDTEQLERDEVDEKQLVGLRGVVKISHIVFNGASLLRLDGFAPAGRWEELSPANLDNPQVA
jgi:biotin operon repressor